MNDPGQPRVSVVVVNYNGLAHLAECLTALQQDDASPPFEIIVVDNASTDGSLGLLAEWATPGGIRVVENTVNRGYAGGVNSARRQLRGDFVVALNPDCVVTPGWLSPLVEFLDGRPEAGAANPLILLHADDERINAAGQSAHVTGLGFNRWLWRPRGVAGARPFRVSGLQGGALIVRRDLLEQMDGWDESGFLYHEDVELSWLLQLMGYDLYCVPAAVVWHKYHLTMYADKLFLLERNRWAMLRTHVDLAALALISPLLGLTEIMMWGYCLVRGPAFLRAKLESYRWHARNAAALARRRAQIAALRRRTDWQLLKRLDWNYAWDQFLSLGRERGPSRRQPAGGLPVDGRRGAHGG